MFLIGNKGSETQTSEKRKTGLQHLLFLAEKNQHETQSWEFTFSSQIEIF